jgi:hypothetical protein
MRAGRRVHLTWRFDGKRGRRSRSGRGEQEAGVAASASTARAGRRAIKRNYLADHGEGRDAVPGTSKSPSPVEKLKAEVVRLQGELDAANAKIRRLERAEGEALLITRKDTPEQILTVLESEVSAKAARIAGLLLNQQKSTAPTRHKPSKTAKLAQFLYPSTSPSRDAPLDEALAGRIREYAERHPKDTPSIIASVLKCPVEAVRHVLGEEPR